MFRIEASIQRSDDGGETFTEIGFCAGDSSVFDDAAYEVGTYLQRREWETEPGMPDPSAVDS